MYIRSFKKIKGMGMYVRLRYLSFKYIYIKLRPRCKYDVKDCPIFDLFYLLRQAEMLLNFTGPRFFFMLYFID